MRPNQTKQRVEETHGGSPPLGFAAALDRLDARPAVAPRSPAASRARRPVKLLTDSPKPGRPLEVAAAALQPPNALCHSTRFNASPLTHTSPGRPTGPRPTAHTTFAQVRERSRQPPSVGRRLRYQPSHVGPLVALVACNAAAPLYPARRRVDAAPPTLRDAPRLAVTPPQRRLQKEERPRRAPAPHDLWPYPRNNERPSYVVNTWTPKYNT